MEKSLGLAFGVRVRVRVGLGVNKLDVNYNIVTSPLYSTLAIAALGYSGPESPEVPFGYPGRSTVVVVSQFAHQHAVLPLTRKTVGLKSTALYRPTEYIYTILNSAK